MSVLDLRGPLRAEVLVMTLGADGAPVLAGPCGPEPWHLEVSDGEDPSEVVRRIAGSVLGPIRIAHSTSWRWEAGSVVLTFLAVVDDAPAGRSVSRSELARGGRDTPPAVIAPEQVAEHALRHLRWLAVDDPEVAAALTPQWHQVLEQYTPEPFRAWTAPTEEEGR